jgi:hypothetical protein
MHEPDKFEETDWDVKPVVISVVSLLSLMVVGLAFGWVTTRVVMVREARHVEIENATTIDSVQIIHNRIPPPYEAPVFQTKHLPPAPRLQVDEAADLKELRDRETSLLTSYQWLDKANGVVRIPIDRAIDLEADELGGGK